MDVNGDPFRTLNEYYQRNKNQMTKGVIWSNPIVRESEFGGKRFYVEGVIKDVQRKIYISSWQWSPNNAQAARKFAAKSLCASLNLRMSPYAPVVAFEDDLLHSSPRRDVPDIIECTYRSTLENQGANDFPDWESANIISLAKAPLEIDKCDESIKNQEPANNYVWHTEETYRQRKCEEYFYRWRAQRQFRRTGLHFSTIRNVDPCLVRVSTRHASQEGTGRTVSAAKENACKKLLEAQSLFAQHFVAYCERRAGKRWLAHKVV